MKLVVAVLYGPKIEWKGGKLVDLGDRGNVTLESDDQEIAFAVFAGEESHVRKLGCGEIRDRRFR